MTPQLLLLSSWEKLDDGTAFVNELNKELRKDHPLFSKMATALARAVESDDVLFQINDGESHRYAVVHLTWTGKAESAKLPRTQFFESLTDFANWMQRDHVGPL